MSLSLRFAWWPVKVERIEYVPSFWYGEQRKTYPMRVDDGRLWLGWYQTIENAWGERWNRRA